MEDTVATQLVKLKIIMFVYYINRIFDCRCLNACTYCKTKHARGELGSYSPEEIVARAKQSFEGEQPMNTSKQMGCQIRFSTKISAKC